MTEKRLRVLRAAVQNASHELKFAYGSQAAAHVIEQKTRNLEQAKSQLEEAEKKGDASDPRP